MVPRNQGVAPSIAGGHRGPPLQNELSNCGLLSLLYERVGLSRDKEGVLALARQGELVTTPAEMVRDPYVFEFLGLKREELYTESQLERALLDHLQGFLRSSPLKNKRAAGWRFKRGRAHWLSRWQLTAS